MCIYLKFRVGVQVEGLIWRMLRPGRAAGSVSVQVGEVFLVPVQSAGGPNTPGSSQAKTLPGKPALEGHSPTRGPERCSDTLWTHLAGRQRRFLARLAEGSSEAGVKDAGGSGERRGGVELSRKHRRQTGGGSGVPAAGSAPTFLIFAGVGVPARRLLDGVSLTVPYSISSCVCLVFFICCFGADGKPRAFIQRWGLGRGERAPGATHPLQFLLLLLAVVPFPLLLHVLQERLPVDLEFCPAFLLPHVNLGFQTLFQLERGRDQR